MKVHTIKDKRPTLEELQELVGGYIEVVYIKNGDQLIVDEDGLMRQKFPNEDASILAGKPIVGNAVLLKGKGKLR